MKDHSGGSKTAATSKMERFVIIVNGCKPLTIIAKCSILDVAGVLDPPPLYYLVKLKFHKTKDLVYIPMLLQELE